MRVRIAVIGKLDGFIREGIGHYEKFLRRFCRLEVLEIKRIHRGSIEEIVRKETEDLANRILPGSSVVVMDRKGEEVSSEEFSDFLKDLEMRGKDITILIGGPYGLSEEIFAKAHRVFSLSKMTFTHGMTVLIVLEQIFRAFKIIHGENYHY
ncbi:23S rRNA (pseudouridine(1915)-N(3))-methyltransferase RlmH [Thermotoga sp. 38H-to]|uniref:23S rRNA (pseudouridine(1915)-N(3))-methyltransferase RlmH n=1 Tax=Thermotoga sp. 38H-to TaxID=1755812 RepID=UPI0013EDA4E9|nr:23S rRNA (pseudouridine(1915)-N(3))-methyltransferase RlmH [Thermotoga sp. 38H-to]KAF2959684.1 50S rRNA methyltransferase [Thermotoga sp. 38H-to]